MRIDRPPYWYWQLDRWNILVAVLLLGAVAATAATGGASAPAAVTPTITQPAAGAALDYAAPGAITGRAAPGARVRIFDGDIFLGETVADQAGYYHFSLPTLAPGPHSLTTRVYDARGNLLASSEPVTINIVGGPAVAQASPTSGPASPTPTTQPPAFSGLTDGAQLVSGAGGELTGTASAGATVRLFADDKPIGEAVAGSDGQWRLPLPALPVGEHMLVARAYAPDGTLLAESAPVRVTVAAPTATATPTPQPTATPTASATPQPTVAAPTFVGLSNGGLLPADKPSELVGTAAPGTKIQVYDGDKLLGEITAGPDGKWRLPLPALTAGEHTLTARAMAPDGSVLAVSPPIKVAALAVPPPTFEGLAEGSKLPAGQISELSGTAAPGMKVQVYDGNKLLGEATAGPDGKWRLIVPALAVGAHVLSVWTVGPDGNALAASAPIAVEVALPTATLSAPTATPSRTPTLAPTATATLAPTPTLPPGAETATLSEGAPISLAGTAGPGTRLRIYDGETPIGEAVADADGQWHLALPPLAPGLHILTARVYDDAGRLVSSSMPLYLTITPAAGVVTPVAPARPTIATPALVLPEITSPRPGAQLPATAPGLLEGTAESGSTVRIYDGDKLIAEVVTGADGVWRILLPALGVGAHALTVRAVMPDGTEQLGGASLSVTVVAAPAAPPLPPAPTGAIAPTMARPAAAVQSSQPLLSGAAAPRSTVRIYEGDFLLGETRADARGRWYFVPPIALAVGKHTLRVTSVGPDGKEVAGGVIEIVVAPGATGLKPLTLARSTGKAPSTVGLLQGVAPPNTLVSIYEGTTLLAKVLADDKGQWSYALPARTRLGQHLYRIVVSTRDGITLYETELIPITIS